MACISIFAGRGIITAFQTINKLKNDERLKLFMTMLIAILVLCHILLSIRTFVFLDMPDNKYQHYIFNTINVLTDISDPIYDNSGSYVSRPHAYFWYFTSILMRQKWMYDQLITDVPKSIKKNGCTVFIKDIRTESLPKQLILWLKVHFLPYNKDIYIWGSKYNSGGSGKVIGKFEAIRQDKYFISPLDIFEKGQLFINNNEIKTQIVTLKKGNHDVFFTGDKKFKFRILWLPRNNLPFQASFPLKYSNEPFSYIRY